MRAAVMHAVVVAEGGEGGCGLGESLENVLVGGVVTEVGIVDVVTGEADQVGFGGDGETGDVVQVMEGDGRAEVEVREVDEAHGAGKAGQGDTGPRDLNAPFFDESGVDAEGSRGYCARKKETSACHLANSTRRTLR